MPIGVLNISTSHIALHFLFENRFEALVPCSSLGGSEHNNSVSLWPTFGSICGRSMCDKNLRIF